MTFDLYELKRRLGGVVYDGGSRWLGPGPGHRRRDKSLSLRLVPDRVQIYSFVRDPIEQCAKHVGLDMSDVGRPSPAERERLNREHEAERRAKRNRDWEFCEEVWAGTVTLEGTPGEVYLTGRGLTPPYPADLRFHPTAPFQYVGRRCGPALVALVRSPDGTPLGLHRTALLPDGSGKEPGNARLMFGPVGGGAVHLAPPYERELAVSEGIESGLSFWRLKGIPTWAALSTSGLRAFRLPRRLFHLHIAADGDAAGRGAAEDLIQQLGRRYVMTNWNPGDHLDWNDRLVREMNIQEQGRARG